MGVRKTILAEIERCNQKALEWSEGQRQQSDFTEKHYYSGVARAWEERAKGLEWVLALLNDKKRRKDERVPDDQRQA